MLQTYNVLFLCTGNSARSILAEAILNRLGKDRFRAFSAGSYPKGAVHPFALDLLNGMGFDTSFARSKSRDEFAGPDAPHMDFVFTICDAAAEETCPVWPGHPMTAHWGIPDPATAQAPEAERHLAFVEAYRILSSRISIFLSLPHASIDRWPPLTSPACIRAHLKADLAEAIYQGRLTVRDVELADDIVIGIWLQVVRSNLERRPASDLVHQALNATLRALGTSAPMQNLAVA